MTARFLGALEFLTAGPGQAAVFFSVEGAAFDAASRAILHALRLTFSPNLAVRAGHTRERMRIK